MSPVPTRSAHARYTLSLCSASTAIDSVEPMRSCPSVAAFDQGIVTWVATRRPGRWSDGSSRCRKGVATHVTIPWSNAATLGQERIGSTLSIAVDALHSDNVYLAWAARVGTGDHYTVHVRRSTDRGATWSSDLRTLTNATDASLAVSTNGT